MNPLVRAAAAGALLWLAAGPLHAAATLTPFASEADYVAALTRWSEPARQRAQARQAEQAMADAQAASKTAAEAVVASKSAAEFAGAAKPMAAPAPAPSLAAAPAAADAITNVQTAGVDEGGIVKHAGAHLVVLRRGRLFTVRVGGNQLQPVAAVNAYAPGSNPRGAWYDELLVSGRDVVVIGYSYARGGTEIGRFRLGDDGSLAYRSTHHLRSWDYYSSRNYASRLVGRTLVFYSPVLLQPSHPQPWAQWPGLRRWQADAVPGEFQRLLPATRIYRSDDELDPGQPLALHTVTQCPLDAPELGCQSTAVLGPQGRVFYVSANSVYVWAAGGRGAAQAAVFRLPLDGAAPTGIKAAGMPVDQLSFLEADGHLNVLLRGGGAGESMFGAERGSSHGNALALLRLPLTALGDGRQAAQREHYRKLPPAGVAQNRYVGDWLLYGGQDGQAWALRPADATAEPQRLAPGHAVQRIEALGRDAVLVGNAGADLHFTALRLGGDTPEPAGRHVQPNARQGEQRTHGFFYRPTGADEGLLGLPILHSGQRTPRSGVYAGAQGSASVTYLRHRQGHFMPLGELQASSDAPQADGCQASCVDWYGNARPIFLGERVFALLGYELVEGRVAGGLWHRERISELRRVSFAPGPAPGQRYSPFQ